MNIEQTVRGAFTLSEPAPDFEEAVMARLSAASWRASQGRPRRRRSMLLAGVLLAVAAAASMWFVREVNQLPAAIVQGASMEGVVPPGMPVVSDEPDTSNPAPVQDRISARPATVLLVLNQLTDDAAGRDFGQQVYESAREELDALPGLLLVDGTVTGASIPAFRITYTNLATSGFPLAGRSDEPSRTPIVTTELVFMVEAFQPGADGAGSYRIVFWSGDPPTCTSPECISRYRALPPVPPSTRLDMVSVRPGVPPFLPVECTGSRGDRCAYTAADIAAYTILSWRLKTTAPDPLLVERLRAMLVDSSAPPALWMMAYENLGRHGKLRADASGLLADGGVNHDAELRAALVAALINGGNGRELMRLAEDRLFGMLPNTDRKGRSAVRTGLVKLLATELRNEPGAPAMLQSVAANDPDPHVRAEARRVLGLDPEWSSGN